MEGQGEAGNNILEDDNNGVLETKGSKKHLHLGIEGDKSEDDEEEEERQLVGCLSCFTIFMPQGLLRYIDYNAGHHGEEQIKENENLPDEHENTSGLPQENGISDQFSPLNSDKAAQEVVQVPLLNGTDDHLIELSDSLKTVANTLKIVSEQKDSALAEAAEWKRKYELERARNLHLERKGLFSSEERHGEDQIKENGNLPDEHVGVDEICSHEVLHSGSTDPDSNILQRKLMRKASIKLSWSFNGDKSDQHKRDIVSFEMGNITTAERSSKQISLKWESPPQTVLILIKPNSTSVKVLCSELVRWFMEEKGLNIFVEPGVRGELLSESSYYSFVQTWQEEKEIMGLHRKVDFVVTLGGDGTVLWAASLFKGAVPPIVPFSLGSLGFMTTFCSDYYREILSTVLDGPISITLRHRLQCYVVRDTAKREINEHEGPILVLNEVTIDRGISSFLANLECYCDNIFVTRVQGDGLILSTTSGSTAYSLSAGGSMVHPQVPAILFTPICPHSLSFRPLILPEHVTVRVQVPLNSRGHAWASFDGKNRKQLGPGDALVCSMAPWPVPTACQADSTSDFLRSIHDGLHWNLRKTQSSDGPRET